METRLPTLARIEVNGIRKKSQGRQLLVTTLAFVFLSFIAHAAVVIDPLSWGMHPGDSFRLVVITAGRTTASSSSIATYDSFVNTQGLSGITYNGTSLGWQALGLTQSSSPLTDASRYSSQANAKRIYNLNGSLVSNTTNGTAFWKMSGYNAHLAPIDWTINGSGNLAQVNGSQLVWTGFDIDGSVASARDYDSNGFQIGTVAAALGQSVSYLDYDFSSSTTSSRTLNPYAGRAGASANGWAALDNSALTTELPMYAMSELITVTAVPEPSASTLAGLACVVYLLWRRRTRA